MHSHHAVRARARTDRNSCSLPAHLTGKIPTLALLGAVSLAACDRGSTASAPGAVPPGHEESVAYVVNGTTYPLIKIAPRDNALSTGQQVSLVANLSSPTANWVGRQVTYTSSNTAVVSAQTTNVGAANGDTARLTAVAAGTAIITATTQSGTTDTLHVTVGGAPAPPNVPNALSACSVVPNLVSWNFPSQSWGPLDFHSFLDGGQVVVDPTAPTGYSARWNWSFNPNADEGGQINAVFPSRQSAYVRFAYKQDPNFPDNGIKKILRFRAGGYNQLLGTLDIDGDKYIWFYDVLDGRHVWYQTAGATPSANRGSWHWFEVYNDISQSGNLRFKVWLDGQLIISGTDPVSNQGLSFGIASPGGTFNQPAGIGTDWVTEIGVSSSCLGAPW
jgi:hypothetical protein